MPYKNLNPANEEFNAILSGKRGISLGFLSFKNSKACSPFKKFLFKKYERTDPVSMNRKYFRANPDFVEFAKFDSES